MSLYKRKRILPQAGTETFFLWGARQAGKSSLLREAYADAVWVDLLKADGLELQQSVTYLQDWLENYGISLKYGNSLR